MAKARTTAFSVRNADMNHQMDGAVSCLQGLEFHGGGTGIKKKSGSQGGLGPPGFEGPRNPQFQQPDPLFCQRLT